MRNGVRAIALAIVALGAMAQYALAQNFDSGGIYRVGFFGQMSKVDFHIDRWSQIGSLYSGDTNGQGAGGGFAVGYDRRLGKGWLVGVEADASIDNARSLADQGRHFNSDYFASVRGRLGYYPTRDWLIYATGGLAVHGVEFKGLSSGNTAVVTKTSSTQGGGVFGGGSELDLDGYTVFAEVLFSQAENWNFRATDVNYNYQVQESAAVARIGVKFKIGLDYERDLYRRDARR